jgi:hypothetical protein
LHTLLLIVVAIAAFIVAAQVSWRYFRTDAAWRSFPRGGELKKSTSSTLLNPQYEIDISDNPNLRDRDLATFSGLSTIKHLDASNTPLTDQCLTDLQRLRSLKSINIRGTRISPQGVHELRQALPNCTIHYDHY